MKVYRGTADGPSSAHVVEVWDRKVDVCTPDGRGVPDKFLGVLRHVVKHSPTGFSWGYTGSGPAELARCILLDHLGDAAVCPVCRGTRRVVFLEAVGVGTQEAFPSRPFVEGEDDETESYECHSCWGEGTILAPATYQAFKFEFVQGWPQTGTWEISASEIDAWMKDGARGL